MNGELDNPDIDDPNIIDSLVGVNDGVKLGRNGNNDKKAKRKKEKVTPATEEQKVPKSKDIESQSHLKKLYIAEIVAKPRGCMTVFMLAVLFLIISTAILFGDYQICLNVSFSDFQVIGSKIVQRYYIKNQLSDNSFRKSIYKKWNMTTDDEDEVF